MKEFIILFMLFVVILFISGCAEKAQESYNKSQNTQNNSANQQIIQNDSQIQQAVPDNSFNKNDIYNNSTSQKIGHNNSTTHQTVKDKRNILKDTMIKRINASLQKGPVFLEFGAVTCSECKDMKPILKQLAEDYRNKITVISIDIGENPKLAEYFGAHVVPVSFVITGIKNASYTFMLEDGNISENMSQSKIIGLKDKEVFEKLLDSALSREKKV